MSGNLSLSLSVGLSLGGYPPFHENFGHETISDQIIRGEFTMLPVKWKNVSDHGNTAVM